MSSPSQSDDASREMLVAYLDGELSPEEARDVERRISEDPELRQEMQSLEKAWNALDDLPKSTVDEDFSRTTIEMVAVEAQREVAELTAAMPVTRRRRWWGVALLGAAAAVAGFMMVRGFVSTPDRQLVQDLPVLWGIEPLSQNADAQFLTLLASRQPDLVQRHGCCQVQDDAAEWTKIAGESRAQRRARLRDLSGVDQDRLKTAERRFLSLSETRQQALRDRYESIAQAPSQTPDLRRVALAYADWTAGLTPNTQFELRQIADPEERVDRVADLRRQELARARRDLTTRDEARLRKAIAEVAQRPGLNDLYAELRRGRNQRLDAWEARGGPNEPRHAREFRKKVREWSDRFDAAIESQPALRVAMIPQVAFGGDRNGGGRPWPGIRDELRDRAREEWAEMEPLLTRKLGEPVLEGLSDDPPERRASKMRQWILKLASDDINPSSMEGFFTSDALTDKERMELLALPRNEMDERIRHLYVERQLGGVDPRTLEEMTRALGGRDGRGPDGRGRPDKDRRGRDDRDRDSDDDRRGPPKDPRGER